MQSDSGDRSEVVAKPNRRRRVRRLWMRFVALGCGFVFATLLCEVSLRIYVASRGWTPNCYVGGIQLRVPHDANGYTLASGHRFRSGAYAISTNSLGLRGSEVKSGDVEHRRIAVVGGSSVFGYLVSDGQEACRLLEHRLRAGDPNVEVINAGVPGYNLFQTTIRYQETVAPLSPDVVVVYLGWNDLVYLTGAQSPDQSRAGSCAASWERLAAGSVLYGFVVHRLLGRTAVFNPPAELSIDVTEPGAAQFRENLNRLADEVSAGGAELIVCSQASLAHRNASDSALQHVGSDREHAESVVHLAEWLRDNLKRFAESRSVRFIDVYNLIQPTEENLGDVIHLTAHGEEQLAEILADALGEHSAAIEPSGRSDE